MQLMTKELKTRFEEMAHQVKNDDPIVIAKYYNPWGGGFWYATEYFPNSKIFYGYVSVFGALENVWRYFSLQELEEYDGPFELGVLRDMECGEFPISRILKRNS